MDEGPFYLRPTPYSTEVESVDSMRYMVVEEAMRELRVLVAAANNSALVPNPYAAVFGDWTNKKRGVHLWDIGAF